MASNQIDLILNNDKISYFGAKGPLQKDLSCDYRFCGCRRTRFIWISHQKKVIYFGVPKAASSSIRHVLGVAGAHAFLESSARAIMHHGGASKLNFLIDPNTKPVGIKQRLKQLFKPNFRDQIISQVGRQKRQINKGVNQVDYSSYSSSYGFKLLDLSPGQAIAKYPDYFSFTFIRSPWGRVASSYKMFIASKEDRYHRFATSLFGENYKDLSFSEFIERIKEVHNCHWNQAINFLPRSKKGKVLVDFVGKVESIDKDWGYISEKLGLPIKLPRLKKSSKSNKVTWNKKTIDIVGKLFADDIKYFGYKK